MQAELFKRTEAEVCAEIAHVMSLPEGGPLSQEAQAMYEADGAERFKATQSKSIIHVTQDQKGRIEAAWRICSNRTRSIGGRWIKVFDDIVADVIGRRVPPHFVLVVEDAAQAKGGV